MRKKSILKAVINLIYLLLGALVLELVGRIPVLKEIWLINSGSALDIIVNVVGTLIMIVLLIIWALHLFDNLKCYNSKQKSGKEVRCSVFNPFC